MELPALRSRIPTLRVHQMMCAQEGAGAFGTAMQLGLFLMFAATGCRTLSPLPPANLNEPGWTVRQGQAVWRSGSKMPEIAGELLLATKQNGNQFIQFTKTPFPFVIAQKAANHWEVQFPTENKRYSGLGKPPRRLIWFWLPEGLAGTLPPNQWLWHQDANGWHLENRNTGEWLEGYLNGHP